MSEAPIEVIRVISDYESEPVDLAIDLAAVTRIDQKSRRLEGTDVIGSIATLASTNDGQPIVIVQETIRDGEWADAEGNFYTEMQPPVVFLHASPELARADFDEHISDGDWS